MNGKLLSATVAAAAILAWRRGADAQPKKYVFALVPKNMNNPFFDQARDGCMKAEKELGGASRVPVYRPRRAWRRRGAGAGRARPDRQEGRRHRRVALERRGHGQGAGGRQGGRHPGADLGQRPAARRTRPCGSPMSARTTTTSASTSPSWRRRSSPRAARSASSPAAPPRPTTTSACRASATRSPAPRARRRPATKLTGQNGWTEVGRLPALHRRRLPAVGAADGGHPRQVSRSSTPSSRPAASRSSSRRPTGRSPRSTRRASPTASLALVVADTLPVQMELMKAGLSTGQVGQRPFEMGYKTHVLPEGHQGRQAGADRPDLHRPRRLHAGDRRHLHRQVRAVAYGKAPAKSGLSAGKAVAQRLLAGHLGG